MYPDECDSSTEARICRRRVGKGELCKTVGTSTDEAAKEDKDCQVRRVMMQYLEKDWEKVPTEDK